VGRGKRPSDPDKGWYSRGKGRPSRGEGRSCRGNSSFSTGDRRPLRDDVSPAREDDPISRGRLFPSVGGLLPSWGGRLPSLDEDRPRRGEGSLPLGEDCPSVGERYPSAGDGSPSRMEDRESRRESSEHPQFVPGRPISSSVAGRNVAMNSSLVRPCLGGLSTDPWPAAGRCVVMGRSTHLQQPHAAGLTVRRWVQRHRPRRSRRSPKLNGTALWTAARRCHHNCHDRQKEHHDDADALPVGP
jgi:hypothetical protein